MRRPKGVIDPRLDWRRPHHWLAYGFGSGFAPWAPGTMGTLAAVPLYLLLQPLPLGGYLLVLLVLFLAGIWACDKTARELDAHDPSAVVWDEVVGYLLTMTAAPPGWVWVAVGFILFRFFDILKPWPISAVDRGVRGGLGVMLDDLAAGIAAWGVMRVVAALLS